MTCPRDGQPLSELVVGVARLERCATCRGVWGERAAIEALTGGPWVARVTSVSLGEVAPHELAPACPICDGALESAETADAPGREVLACAACAKWWVDLAVLDAIRAKRRASAPPPAPMTATAPAVAPAATDARAPASFEPEAQPTPFMLAPIPELIAIPLLFALAWLVASTQFGELLATFPRIQFHELGHALVAWSTGRRALPLPCGFTFWSLERSPLLVLAEIVFCALWLAHGLRTRNRPAALGAMMVGAILGVGLATPLDASEPWLVAGGGIGEILLPALATAAFHLPLPRRARWDFWRWLVLLAALFALASVVQMWWDIASGAREMPFGSFLSGRESGDGDLERLVNDYGWTEPGLRVFYGRLATLAVAIALVPHLLWSGARVVAARKAT